MYLFLWDRLFDDGGRAGFCNLLRGCNLSRSDIVEDTTMVHTFLEAGTGFVFLIRCRSPSDSSASRATSLCRMSGYASSCHKRNRTLRLTDETSIEGRGACATDTPFPANAAFSFPPIILNSHSTRSTTLLRSLRTSPEPQLSTASSS